MRAPCSHARSSWRGEAKRRRLVARSSAGAPPTRSTSASRWKTFRTAEQDLRAALRLDPRDAYANDFLASLERLEGNLEAALLHWNRTGQPVLGNVRAVPPLPLDSPLAERAIAISAGQV